jgi:hypothetical protein
MEVRSKTAAVNVVSLCSCGRKNTGEQKKEERLYSDYEERKRKKGRKAI